MLLRFLVMVRSRNQLWRSTRSRRSVVTPMIGAQLWSMSLLHTGELHPSYQSYTRSIPAINIEEIFRVLDHDRESLTLLEP